LGLGLVLVMVMVSYCSLFSWLVRPLAESPPPIEYTDDSLLRLLFQFTERQQKVYRHITD